MDRTSEERQRVHLPDARIDDVDVVVLVRTVSGTRAEAGGIAWRVLDKQNYYALLLDGRAGEMSLLRVERGRAVPLPFAGEAMATYMDGVAARIARP